MNLHIKLKHNGGNKTDREKIAKSLVYAKAQGLNIPIEITSLNLPPGSIESAAEQVGLSIDKNMLQKMEEELRKQNKVSEQEMKKAELIKTKSKYMNV